MQHYILINVTYMIRNYQKVYIEKLIKFVMWEPEEIDHVTSY